MPLLQISEPSTPGEQSQDKPVVGIDLGTTNSLVATVRNKTPEVLNGKKGAPFLVPSVVRYLATGDVQVGLEACHFQTIDPKNTISSVKRFMGRGLKEISYADSLPYDFLDTPRMVSLKTAAGVKSPVEVSAEIINVLRQHAEHILGSDLAGAVITVPAYFDDSQRQATRDAAKLAGLNVLRLLNEPTAAALAYGLDNNSEGIYVVYDLGGGTFDISILKLTKGMFEVLAIGGDSALGGDDFDRSIFSWIIEKSGLKSLSNEDVEILMAEARKSKEILSTLPEVDICFNLSLCRQGKLRLTIEIFNSITEHLVAKTLTPIRRAMRDTKLGVGDVNGVVLVGGASRMPSIREAVSSYFKTSPLTNIDPEKVVAIGAAIQANMLAGNLSPTEDDWLLLDVIPLSLGIETMGGLVEKIIPRNSTIPCAYEQEFTTFKDGQSAMTLHVLQGERELVSDCRSLAKFELDCIPPMAAGTARVKVKYQVDADGLLSVSARETCSGIETSINVRPSYQLEDSDIKRMLQESADSANIDMQARAIREARIEADRIISATESALSTSADLLSEKEYADVVHLIDVARLEIQRAKDYLAIKAATEALARGTEEFATRRMDRSVHNLLTGKQIDQTT
jgi:molecular chaperone HscA